MSKSFDVIGRSETPVDASQFSWVQRLRLAWAILRGRKFCLIANRVTLTMHIEDRP